MSLITAVDVPAAFSEIPFRAEVIITAALNGVAFKAAGGGDACWGEYPIGSEVAEDACRNLVKDRMDGTGMHWKIEGARAMLWTRALYLNGEWNDFVDVRIQREQEQLCQTAA